MSFFGKRLTSYWGTWAAVGVVTACEAVAFWWFDPGFKMSMAFVGVGLAWLAAWPVFFARSSANVTAIATARQQIESATVASIQALEDDLLSVGARDAVRQLVGLGEKRQTVTEILERQLNAGELAFSRHLGLTEQVYLSSVDNLKEVAITLRSIASIKTDEIEQRLRELDRSPPQAGAATEKESLRERQELHRTQTDKVAELIAKNERAMTGLTRLGIEWADIRTNDGHAELDADAALAALKDLADSVKRFDKERPSGRLRDS